MAGTVGVKKWRTTSLPVVIFNADMAAGTVTSELVSSAATGTVQGEADVITWNSHCLLRQEIKNSADVF